MPAHDLALLIEAAKGAGDIASRFWSGENTVWDKGRDDPVSDADLATDTYLRETLTAARPDYGWLSEETADDQTRLARDTTFIVDPIDGTRAFIDGQKTWAHSIATAHQGQVTAGVVFLPLRDKLYAAARGEGATLNGAPIRTSTTTDMTAATILANRWAYEPRYWTDGPPEAARHFRPSIAYRLCLVAEGRFDAMVTFRDSWEWDIAAGALIVEEAGGQATEAKGSALTFNTKSRAAKGILAATPALHDGLRHQMA